MCVGERKRDKIDDSSNASLNSFVLIATFFFNGS
jgi:hypothetical protein